MPIFVAALKILRACFKYDSIRPGISGMAIPACVKENFGKIIETASKRISWHHN
jgi:hypothetical protein